MKFWNDDYDTVAGETLDNVKAELLAMGCIGEEDWEEEYWEECDGAKLVWIVPLEDLDHKKLSEDETYKNQMKKEYMRTLIQIMDDPKLRPDSITGKAWFIASTEY